MEDEGLIGALSQAANSTGRGLINPLSNAGLDPVQVDLNDPAQLADLEDAGLMDHMDAARAQLVAQELASKELVDNEILSKQEIEGRCALSDVMNLIREQRQLLASVRDAVYLNSSNAEKLSKGIAPHGYPSVNARSGAGPLELLSTRINDMGTAVEQIYDTLTSAESVLMRARRSVESVMVGRNQRCIHYESAWKELSQTLKKQW